MKRALTLLLVLSPLLSPARAFNLNQAIDGAAGVLCGAGSITTNLGFGSIALPVTSMADLQGFCRAYEVYKRSQNFGAILADAGKLALQNLFQGVVDGLLGGTANALRPLLGPVNQYLSAFAEAANRALNLPYLTAGAIYGVTYNAIYSDLYKSLTDSATSGPVQAPTDSVTQLNPVDGELAQAYNYPTEGEVKKANEAHKEDAAKAAQAVSDAAAVAEVAAKGEEAAAKAEEAAREVKEATSREAIRQAISGQAETAKKVAEAAAQVTATTPTGPGKAEQYRQAAENAPSDRALLELQVKALADLMEQQAVYMPYLAELLVQQSKVQAMTTQDLKDTLSAESARYEGALSEVRVERLLEEHWKTMADQAESQTTPMRRLLAAACAFYSGGSAEGCE